jgi:hypothetical protein
VYFPTPAAQAGILSLYKRVIAPVVKPRFYQRRHTIAPVVNDLKRAPYYSARGKHHTSGARFRRLSFGTGHQKPQLYITFETFR